MNFAILHKAVLMQLMHEIPSRFDTFFSSFSAIAPSSILPRVARARRDFDVRYFAAFSSGLFRRCVMCLLLRPARFLQRSRNQIITGRVPFRNANT